MPRKTTLSIISERAVGDSAAMARAEAEMEALTPLPAPPQDILAQLRHENAQLHQIVAEQTGRVEAAEKAVHETMTTAAHEREQVTRAAAAQVEKARAEASNAVKTAITQSAVAEKTAMAAAQVRQTAGMLAQFGSFLIDRTPVLATLAGAYFLARDMLPTPGAMQLGLLGIYGVVGVLPAVWWSLRKK